MMDDLVVNVMSPFDLDSEVGIQWIAIRAHHSFLCVG